MNDFPPFFCCIARFLFLDQAVEMKDAGDGAQGRRQRGWIEHP